MLIKLRNLIVPFAKVNKYGCAAFISTSPVSTSSSKSMEEIIKVGKYNINFLKVGNGSHHILCMPGALGTIWTDFKPQVEGLNREKFTLVVWDPPGYGKSRPPDRDFTADLFHRDADAAYEFMQALNIPKYSVIGWSDGGRTAMIHAAKYSSALKKLVICGSNSYILPHELELYKKTRDIKTWSKKMRDPMVDIYGEEAFAKLWAQWIDGTMISIYNKNNGNICAEMLKDIKCPTFIFYGKKDPMVDNVHVSYLNTRIKDSRIHLYPEGKHNIHLKYAEDFNRRVEDFLLQP